jgi:DNA-directed RNA polymerases I, II, and III subunit RPABC3
MEDQNQHELFRDVFQVEQIDPDGKKFDRVSRLVCRGDTYGMMLTIDVHSEFFRCKSQDRIKLALTSTININGEPGADTYEPPTERTLLDDYDYGMHGQVFHFENKEENNVAVYISYGGLLMRLEGNRRHVNPLITKNMKLYCLMKKEI